MIKIFTLLALLLTLSNARMIGGVAMTVDNEPITLLEIRNFQQQNKISKEDAVNALVQKKLEDQAIKEHRIFINPLAIDEEIALFAKKNGTDLAGLKIGLAKQGVEFSKFKADLGEKLKRDQLYKKILGKRLKKADESSLKAYYEKNKKLFKMPGDIEVTEYHAKKGELLQAKIMQPMLNIPEIKTKNNTIKAAQINPKLYALLLKTPTKSFTQIINTGDGFVSFFVKSKSKDTILPYEQVKENIFARVMKEKEQALLIEFFEKKKSEAIVKVIRKP